MGEFPFKLSALQREMPASERGLLCIVLGTAPRIAKASFFARTNFQRMQSWLHLEEGH